MTRIFDAFRKAQAHKPPGALQPLPAMGTSPRSGSAVGRALGTPARVEAERAPSVPIRGYALALPSSLDEDVVQQMTSLRISIEAALPEQRRRVVMVQSSLRSEGASTVAQQLAGTLARDGRRLVLVVDAHARHPSLEVDPETHTAFPARSRRAGHPVRSAGDAIHLIAWPVSDDARMAGTFGADALRSVIDSVGVACDWVVVDGPPVLESPDAAALGAVADGVVLVVQAGRTKRPVLARSAELLRKAGARVLGTVLNRRRLEIPGFIYRRI